MVKYIYNEEELKTELKKRKADKNIDQKLENYWKKRGINLKNDSCQKALGSFASPKGDGTDFVSWRNILTPNLEGLICMVFTDLIKQKKMGLNIRLRLLSFPKDHFDQRNLLKKALVTLKEANSDKQRVVDFNALEGIPLDKIRIDNKSLPEVHHEMAQEIFEKDVLDYHTDLLSFFSIALAGAIEKGTNRELKRVGSLYIENAKTGKIEQFSYRKNEIDGINFINEEGRIITNKELISLCKKGLVRPSAKWYYRLFLSMFVSGDRVLLETFDDTTSIIPMVESASLMLEKEIGYGPLIIKMPVDILNPLTGKKVPTEEYPFWAKNGYQNKKQQLKEGPAYKNSVELKASLPFETCLCMIGSDILSQS